MASAEANVKKISKLIHQVQLFVPVRVLSWTRAVLPFLGDVEGGPDGVCARSEQPSAGESHTVEAVLPLPTVGVRRLWLAIVREEIAVLQRNQLAFRNSARESQA